MPNAQASSDSTERFDLKSAPPDGFVVLKRMPYGKWLERRAMTKLTVNSTRGSKDFKGELALMDKRVTELEFKECIIDHNLTMVDGSLFDFTRVGVLDLLDPRVGEEIGTLINGLHDFESEGN